MKLTLIPLAAVVLGAGLVACEPEDPAERAMDHMEEAGDDIKDAGQDVANKVEDTCEDIKEEAGADDTDC